MNIFDKISNLRLPIPISAEMMKKVIYSKSDEIKDLEIVMYNNKLLISGKIYKKFIVAIPIPFSITLSLYSVENRYVVFKLVKFSPVNIKYINKIIFENLPIKYNQKKIYIDLNDWDLINKIPIDNIKKIEIKSGKLLVYLGI